MAPCALVLRELLVDERARHFKVGLLSRLEVLNRACRRQLRIPRASAALAASSAESAISTGAGFFAAAGLGAAGGGCGGLGAERPKVSGAASSAVASCSFRWRTRSAVAS